MRYFGSAKAALQADLKAIEELPGFNAKVLVNIAAARKDQPWNQTLRLVEQHSVNLIDFQHPDYPKGLLDLNDFPVVLYVKGKLSPQDSNGIAVVGTRQASLYGKEMARRLSYDLSMMGYPIVSGLARGIDTEAHQAALQAKGRTIAIIGSGLADIYPRENLALAECIAQQGALISEFPMMTPPDRQNFPQRNRLVATMTKATLLIEAPVRSGAMITVNKALAHRRKAFALPGRIDIESFHGNHALIKTSQAALVESAQDVTSSFSDLFSTERPRIAVTKMEIPLEPAEKELLMQMPGEELSIDDLVLKTKLPVMKLNVLLMSLVLKKMIKEFPGKIFKKTALWSASGV